MKRAKLFNPVKIVHAHFQLRVCFWNHLLTILGIIRWITLEEKRYSFRKNQGLHHWETINLKLVIVHQVREVSSIKHQVEISLVMIKSKRFLRINWYSSSSYNKSSSIISLLLSISKYKLYIIYQLTNHFLTTYKSSR